jgi:membrane protein implicated in regulation of membrane protease activity
MTRAIVLFAAAILAFDGVAVIVLGVLAHRPLFTVMGAVMAAAAVATLWSWTRYRARLDEIGRDADQLKDELRSLDNFIQRR